MQHIKPTSKGDPLCPLGFHPQVRWPTRCKRCFRDYKEHGGSRNKDEDREFKRKMIAVSSPSLTNWSTKNSEDENNRLIGKRSWISSSNLSVDNHCPVKYDENDNSSSCTSSWTSTPNLAGLDDANINGEVVSVTLPRRRPSSTRTSSSEDDYRRTSYTVRRRTTSSLPTKSTAEHKVDGYGRESTTEEQVEKLKHELRNLRIRCEKLEKENSDMLMRRVAFLDSSISTKTTASELSKLQEKIVALTETCENLINEKKALLGRLQHLEAESKRGKFVVVEDEIASLKTRLQAAESLGERLTDENEEMRRELRYRDDELQEMRDNFRENEVDEYSSLKKDLEQTGKNCRILSFKLRKTERKAEQLEAEKLEAEHKSLEAILKLQKELDDANEKIRLHKMDDVKKKAPMLGNIPKVASGEKVSRASLTRGGSQEDPAQLLRDLQDSIEREADLREQLRYAEEEAQNLRRKVTRVEEDNESLMLQLKKMATKAKSNRSSPCHLPVNDNTLVEKDEGISDDDDPAELKVLLDLSEQESGVLRRKVEELEENCDIFKRKASDLQDKLLSKDFKVLEESKSQKLLKTLEAELKEVKRVLLDKENECSRLRTEISSLNEKQKTENLGCVKGDQDRIDVEKQLRMVEQEAGLLRARICSLESENEKLSTENKRLSAFKSTKKSPPIKTDSKSKIAISEKQPKMKVKAIDQGTGDSAKQPKDKCVPENSLAAYQVNSQSSSSSASVQKELSKARQQIEILTVKLKSLEEEKLAGEETVRALNAEILRLKDETKKVEIDFEAERGANNRYKEEQAKQLQDKDTELKLLNKRLISVNENRFDELKKDFDTKLDDFKLRLRNKQKEYQELTNKYEQLEEEHVKLKCQSNLQKEQLQSQIGCLQKELTIVQNELRTLRETYNCRQDEWIKEKLRLEENIKDFETYKSIDENHKLEVSGLKLALEVKESESEHLQKNNFALIDQVDRMRKENEELSKKLDDFEKLIKIQGSMVAESTSLDSQLRDSKIQLNNEREGRKVEVAALKLRYENHVVAIADELKDVQSQVLRLKHERDTFKHLLEESPKHVDVKSNDGSKTAACLNDFEELKSRVTSLKQQVSFMEDELSEARIENSRLKTELVSERSAWQVKLSEMTSKINHLEEERLLHSGRTKSVGLKTRMELSWHKEREEQIRLLQETSTLARDLRQTLFEVERERDKERLEMKRRMDLMKNNSNEEQEEAKKKLHELQRDLLELRDAHAKLRTTNEKLRREKENSFRQNLRSNTNDINSSKVHRILDIIYDLAKLSPSNLDKGLPPVPPKKHVLRDSSSDLRNASRESSLVKEDSLHLLRKLFDLAQQLRETSIPSSRDAARKAFVSNRPASTESDNTMESNKTLQRRGSLYRKCISLEQTSPYETYEPHIWRGDDDTEGSIISSAASVQSTEESYPHKFPHKYDPTFDSRLSGGSTHSEMLISTLERKKKKGILGKLRKLTKSSRSMDDGTEAFPATGHYQAIPGSNNRISSNIIPYQQTVAKKDLKTRITGMFKSSDSRGNSMERSHSLHKDDESNTPEVNNDHINSSQTLPRRTIPSYGKISKHTYKESNQSGATMPRIVSPKK